MRNRAFGRLIASSSDLIVAREVRRSGA